MHIAFGTGWTWHQSTMVPLVAFSAGWIQCLVQLSDSAFIGLSRVLQNIRILDVRSLSEAKRPLVVLGSWLFWSTVNFAINEVIPVGNRLSKIGRSQTVCKRNNSGGRLFTISICKFSLFVQFTGGYMAFIHFVHLQADLKSFYVNAVEAEHPDSSVRYSFLHVHVTAFATTFKNLLWYRFYCFRNGCFIWKANRTDKLMNGNDQSPEAVVCCGHIPTQIVTNSLS